jgi:hypothetical protein
VLRYAINRDRTISPDREIAVIFRSSGVIPSALRSTHGPEARVPLGRKLHPIIASPSRLPVALIAL